jgi:hypothetical protein
MALLVHGAHDTSPFTGPFDSAKVKRWKNSWRL